MFYGMFWDVLCSFSFIKGLPHCGNELLKCLMESFPIIKEMSLVDILQRVLYLGQNPECRSIKFVHKLHVHVGFIRFQGWRVLSTLMKHGHQRGKDVLMSQHFYCVSLRV